MAVVYYTSNNKQAVSKEQGLKIWEALQDPSGLDETQLTYLKSIRRVFLNWHTAPPSYIEANLQAIIPLALNEWVVDKHGKPIKPGTEAAWVFARAHALWFNGYPTALVTGR